MRFLRRVSALLVPAVILLLSRCGTPTAAAPVTVALNSCANFAIMAATPSIAFNGAHTTVTGSVGISTAASITGDYSATASEANTAAAISCKADELTVKGALEGASCDYHPATTDLAGLTLTPGVYCSATTFDLTTGSLVLDAQGDPNSQWIFVMGTALTTSLSTAVSLINGADAANVFWSVGSNAILGKDSDFKGTLVAYGQIDVDTGATINGRLFAYTSLMTFAGGDTVTISGTPSPNPTGPVGGGGDPSFTGFDGQRFQVHGTPGQVYSLISMPCININARFDFIGTLAKAKKDKSDGVMAATSPIDSTGVDFAAYRQWADQAASLEQAECMAGDDRSASWLSCASIINAATVLPAKVTIRFTHPGTYMGSMGIQVHDSKVLVTAGPWSKGLQSVIVNGRPLRIGDLVKLSTRHHKNDASGPATWSSGMPGHALHYSIVRINSHQLVITLPYLRVLITNSDGFVNMEQVAIQDPRGVNSDQSPFNQRKSAQLAELDGLLGQTHPSHAMHSISGHKASDDLLGSLATDRKQRLADYQRMDNSIKADGGPGLNASDRVARNDLLFHVEDYRVQSGYLLGADFNENRYQDRATSALLIC